MEATEPVVVPGAFPVGCEPAAGRMLSNGVPPGAELGAAEAAPDGAVCCGRMLSNGVACAPITDYLPGAVPAEVGS